MQWILNTLADGAMAALLLGFAIWLAKAAISTRLTESVRQETETKLESVRAEIRAAETRLAAVTGAGIAAMAEKSASLYPAQLDAIRTVWAAVLRWREASFITTLVSLLTVDYVRKSGDDPSLRSVVKTSLDTIKHLELMKETGAAEKVRPFLSDRAWALFVAYHGFHISRLIKAAVLSTLGKKADEIWIATAERELIVQSSTPEIVQAYDANVFHGSTKFLGYLQNELLAEFRRDLAGERSGSDTARSAAAIVAAADKLIHASDKKLEVPGGAEIAVANAAVQVAG